MTPQRNMITVNNPKQTPPGLKNDKRGSAKMQFETRVSPTDPKLKCPTSQQCVAPALSDAPRPREDYQNVKIKKKLTKNTNNTTTSSSIQPTINMYKAEKSTFLKEEKAHHSHTALCT